ncbi:PAS domain-containing sensor histidine kinase [Halapricum desulfuricans]|uniref:histidine kinase n=1 Tax=Halapricum desulfuricans TaxID=2841257 RepID=A0A897NP30_9EURY|nr:PAS domain-containing sensor histidine kinase [Halapricum desulfuricans]QSG14508.1 Signal transduction histidine kinase [Halapricum desulfuricans]
MSDQTGIALLDRNGALGAVAEALAGADMPAARSFDNLAEIDGTPDCLVVPDQPETDDQTAINGLALLEAANDQFDCPIAVYTRRDGYEAVRSALDAGATDVLRVPAYRPRLIARRIAAAAGYDDTFRSSGEQITSLLCNYPHTLFLKDDVGRFENVSAHTANNYGFTRQQLIGMSDYELFSTAHADELWEAEQEIVRRGEPEINAVEEYVDQDGERRWVSTTKVPRRGPDGTIVGIVGGTQDVTPAKQQEALMVALHEASRKLTRATTRSEIATVAAEIAAEIDNLPAVQVALADPDGSIQPIDGATAGPDATGGSSGGTAIFERYRDAFQRAYDSDTTQYVDASGDLATAASVVNPVFEGEFTSDEVGIVIPLSKHGVLGVAAPSGIVDEFTDRLAHVLAANVVAAFDRAERERELAEKNRRLEEFATLGAHELRNRLQVVLADITRARSATGPDPLGHAEDTLDRMDRLLTQLLQLAKSGTIPRAVDAVDLRDVACQVWDGLDTPPGATFSPPPETSVVANRGALFEIFEALFDNSIEHGLGTNPGNDATLTVDVGVSESGFYAADDGVGIPDEQRGHLFDVEYARSDDGYGLYIVSALIDAHGWEIGVAESETGGARFEITGVEFR